MMIHTETTAPATCACEDLPNPYFDADEDRLAEFDARGTVPDYSDFDHEGEQHAADAYALDMAAYMGPHAYYA